MVCERQPNLDLRQAQCSKLLHRHGQVCGVETTLDVQYHGKVVIVTTGTFLKGLIHIGQNQQSGGRSGEAAAMGVSASLVEIGLELGRLKTGHHHAFCAAQLIFQRLELQPGDDRSLTSLTGRMICSTWNIAMCHAVHPQSPPIGRPCSTWNTSNNIQLDPFLSVSGANSRVISLLPLRQRLGSSGPICIGQPCIQGQSKVLDQDTAHQ